MAPSLGAASSRSADGISLSYGLGRLFGSQVMAKLGPVLHLSPEHLSTGQLWIQRWGKYALLVAYFDHGRTTPHALLAGASSLPLHGFPPFAYCGASMVGNIYRDRVWLRRGTKPDRAPRSSRSSDRGVYGPACDHRRPTHRQATRLVWPARK